jgi:hypothetical protein
VKSSKSTGKSGPQLIFIICCLPADWPEACSSQLEQYADVVMTVKEVPDDGAPVLVTLTADTLDVRQNLIDLQLAKPSK